MVSLKMSERQQQAVYEMILSYAMKAERISPGGGLAFFKMLAGDTSGSQQTLVKTRQDLLSVLRALGLSKRAYFLLETALSSSTTATKLSIKKSAGSQTYIDVTEGYSFQLKSLLKNPPLDIVDARVACIDGFIESVSEIHQLLTSLSEKKVPCFLFVRGMSDDVLHTIKVNSDRRSIMVYPYVVAYDLENVNTMVDIAVVCGTDVVSNTKGELISSIEISKLGTVESATISGDVIRFKNSKTRRRVKEHVDNLKNTIESRQDISEILGRRLKSLSSSCIDICIPDDTHFFSMSQQLDEGIRVISAAISKKYDPQEAASQMHKAFNETLSDIGHSCLL